jgi:YjjG family noncanonical pyrimidine nucleotidase
MTQRLLATDSKKFRSDYSILLLDLDNTFFDYDRGEIQAFEQTMHHFDFDLSFYERYKVINKGYWDMLERGEITKDRLRIQRFEDLLSELAPDSTVSALELADVYVEYLSRACVLFDHAETVLKTLKPHYKLVALSNGIEIVQMSRLALSGIEPYFDAIIISEKIGANKPSPLIFEAAFEAIDAPGAYEKALMVGDNIIADIGGAKDMGIDTCWMNYNDSLNHSGIVPTYEINKISSLLELLSL